MDFKKTISGFLALFIMVSLLVVPVNAAGGIQTVSPITTTVLGNSSFSWNEADFDMKDNANGYDGTISMATWGNNIRNGVISFNVEKTGTYSLDVNAVVDLTLDGASPISFKIDGGEETVLTTSNTTVSGLTPSWTVNGWTVKKISYTGELMLEKGTHTLTFIIPRRKAGDAVIYAFDCASINPISISDEDERLTVKSDEETIIGNSSFTWNEAAFDMKENANGYDGTISMATWGNNIRNGEITLDVEEAGTYSLDVNAVIDLTLDGASPIRFKIDDGEEMTLTESNTTVSDLTPSWTVNGWTVKKISYTGSFVLEEGTHTLTFIIPRREAGDAVIYAFDCATIKPGNAPSENENITIKSDERTTIGNSSFTWNETGDKNENANGYDGTISMTDRGSNVRKATVTCDVEKSGNYSFEVNGVFDLILAGASPMKFSIDGGEKITLTSSNAVASALATPWTIKSWTVKKISYTDEFMLEEGTHTFELEIPKRSNGDVVIYGFDCITIIPPAPNQLITDENNVLEFEKYYQSNVVASEGASGGYVVDFLQYSSTERIIEMVFDVETAGEYKLVMDASVEQGVSGAQTHLSPVYISVNGETEIEISNNKQSNFSITGDATYKSPNNWTPSRITLATRFTLAEGENKITVRVAARKAGDMVVGTYDCIRLVRKKAIDSITADFGNGILKRGESLTVKMKNQNGETVTMSDFSEITVTSSEVNVVDVINGVLKAKNYGMAKIKITAVSNGKNLEAEGDINVISEKGISIKSLQKTTSGIKVIISAEENYLGGDLVLAGVYEQSENMVTSIKEVGRATIAPMDGSSETSIEIPLSSASDSDVIRVFLVDAGNFKRTIYTKLSSGGVIE